MVMGRMTNVGRGGKQENKRWSSIHGPRFLAVLLVISMIHVAASQNKKTTLEQGLNKIRSPRFAKTSVKTNSQSSKICNTPKCIDAANQINRSMNLSVNPCEDFYEYACGRWSENNPFPPGYSYYSIFKKAEAKTDKYKKRKLEKAKIDINGASAEVQRMPTDFYQSCINLTAIEILGDAPLRKRIRELGGWGMSGNWDENAWDFKRSLLSIHKLKASDSPVFRVYILSDLDDNTKKMISIYNSGIALAKEVYQNLSSESILAYRRLIIEVVVLLGGNETATAQKADEIINLEAQIASVYPSLLEEEEATKRVTTKTLAQLQAEVPEFDWRYYLNQLFKTSSKIPDTENIFVSSSLPYLKRVMPIIQKTPKSVLANYMVWSVIRNEIEWLSLPFRNAQLAYKNATEGTVTEKERWQTCVGSAFESFNDVISAMYVQEHQTELEKTRNMGKSILREQIQAFKEIVKSLNWLDDATKRLISTKIDGMRANIGFPDYMLDSTKLSIIFEKYRGVVIRFDTYFENKVSAMKKNHEVSLRDFRKSKDNTIWYLSPLGEKTENDLQTNTLTIPAAILQRPVLFTNEYLRAFNLGSLGSITSKNILYAFDNIGRTFDKDGLQAKAKWGKNSVKEFDKRQECYAKQYSAYKILGKWPIDGQTKASYNVADNGALKVALKAYYNWANQNPIKKWLLPGLNLTNEQLFYIGYAQKYCSSATDEQRKKQNIELRKTDDKFRIVGSLANSCEFANAFNCRKNSPMNPINKCYLWSKEGLLH